MENKMRQWKMAEMRLIKGVSRYLSLGILLALMPLAAMAQIPDLTGLSLNSSSGNNTKDDDLTVSYNLAGTTTTAATAWYKNGTPIMTLHMPFEGGSTNALKDLSGNNYTVTASGTPIWSTSGGRDGFGGYAFDGTSYLNAGKIFPTKSSYTQTAWIYRTSSGTYDYIIGGRDQSATSGHALRINADQRLSAGQNGSFRIVQGYQGSINSNQWYFAAVTFDYATGTMILYQDGQPIDTAVVPVNARNVIDSTIQIGSISSSTSSILWKGRLDDIRIYNIALTGDQIKLMYESHGGDKVSSSETQVNDTWQARVTPFSSSAIGSTITSNSITIIPTIPAFTSSPVTTGIAGKLYSYTTRATGGPTPTYHLSSSPVGMIIDSIAGNIRWYPATSGIYNITITASNSDGTATQNFSINIANPTVAINSPTVSITTNDSLASSYNLALQATTATTAWYKNGNPIMTFYMPFEGGSVFALDDASGNNITTTPVGNPVWSANGGHDGNGCFTYDGSSYLIAGNIFPTRSSYTKTAWIYRTTTSEYNHILSGWDHNNLVTGGHGLRVSADQRLSAGQNGNWRIVQSNAGAISSNRWYFAAVTFNYSTGEMALYLDGVLINSATVLAGLREVTDPGVLVGATQGAFAWKGRIDDARIYAYPLTPQQIMALYNTNGANRIVAQETQIGEVWQARITPYSTTEAGTPWASNNVIVGNPNRPPVLAAIGSKSVIEGQTLSFTITASDPDATIPALTTSALPTHATFVDSGNGKGSFAFNPDFTQAGTYNISFFASDGNLSDTEIVTITVTNLNHPPILTAIESKSVIIGNLLSFSVTASDLDNEMAILSILNLPTNATFVDHANNTATFSFTPTTGQAGLYNLIFKAADPYAAVDSIIVPVNVIDNSMPANWAATITITGEIVGTALNTAKAIIGVGYDDSISYAPPMPPEYSASIQLWHPGSVGPYSKDIQKTGNKCYYWTIAIDPHGNVAPPSTSRCATISWNPAELSPGRHYALHSGLDPSGPVVVNDLRAITQLQVCDLQTLHYYTIHWEDDSCLSSVYANISLNLGWNLVSLPVYPKDSSLSALFPTAQIAYGYSGQYFEASKLSPGQAYWIKVPAATTVSLTGQPVTSYTASLTPGWHLAGASNCSAAPQTNPEGLITAAYGFNGTYQTAAQFSAGMGYWVKVSSSCTLTDACGVPKESGFSDSDNNGAQLITLHAQGPDLGGVRESDIVIGVSTGERTFPAPPDAPRYSVRMDLYRTGWDGPYFEDIRSATDNDNSWIIALNSHGNIPSESAGEILLSWDPDQMDDGHFMLKSGIDSNGKILVEDMRLIKGIGIKSSDDIQYFTVIRKSGSIAVPATFSLEQNYPNPFNPTTHIGFALSKAGNVSLDIFNINGQKVASLVNGPMEAGQHDIQWDSKDSDGRPLASGIYFYRIKTAGFVDSKKMMLLK
jgi:hypothetical protein